MLDITKTLLRNLGAGDLQNLAFDILPMVYQDWKKPLIHNGICEGGNRTRKGIPDIWGERLDSSLIYIQATADSSKGKMFGDLQKSVDKLVEQGLNDGALCISFLSYEPQPEEVAQCRYYCTINSCGFEFFSNGKVAHLLDQEYNYLRQKYLGVKTSYYYLVDSTSGEPPQTCSKLNEILEWNLDQDELIGNAEELMKFYESISNLPTRSREFYCNILERAEQGSTSEEMEVLAQEIEQVLGITASEVIRAMQVLEQHGFGYIDNDEFERRTMLVITAPQRSWPLLKDLKTFSENSGVNLKSLLVDLDFSLLD